MLKNVNPKTVGDWHVQEHAIKSPSSRILRIELRFDNWILRFTQKGLYRLNTTNQPRDSNFFNSVYTKAELLRTLLLLRLQNFGGG